MDEAICKACNQPKGYIGSANSDGGNASHRSAQYSETRATSVSIAVVRWLRIPTPPAIVLYWACWPPKMTWISYTLDKFAALQKVDVQLPTAYKRTIIHSRYAEPQMNQHLLLQQLRLL